MKLTESVHSLPLEVDMNGMQLTLQPVMVELEDGIALIDAGLPTTIDQLETRIAELGHSLAELRLLVFTHQDGDHAGGGAYAAEQGRPIVCASPGEARPISGEMDPRGSRQGRYTPVPVHVELVEGVRFRSRAGTLEVVSTPGHTPDHISLFLRDRGLLLAADALTAADGVLAGPRPEMSENMEEAHRSMAHLAEYPIRMTHCFHGGLVEAGAEIIGRLVQRSD
jgi:glyoxylase-like metal-dependent hydrolase (beta-lactamase superfamily II)